jgi:transposase-like protein
VLTEEVQRQCQEMLDQGRKVTEVAAEMNVLANTLHKALRAGRLKKRN